MQELTELLYYYGLRILLSIAILLVGWFLIKGVVKLLEKSLSGNFDKILTSFIISLVKTVLFILLFLSAIATVGVEVTSFIAILGGASFAVGLALQGSLSNFAGGILLLVFKPFKSGDFIETADVKGKVVEIQILYTVINTRDNKRVYIPNGNLADETITNFTTNPMRRVELEFGIGYDDDFEQAKEIIKDIVAGNEKINEKPEPTIRVGEHGDSHIGIYTWVWIDRDTRSDYWDVYFYLHEEVKRRFDEAGIGIPYPQLDLHLDKEITQSLQAK